MSKHSLQYKTMEIFQPVPVSEIEMSARQFEIVTAAGKILTKSGISGLTIKNLAKEMDFSESAIYRHYPGKEDIIVTMLDYLAYDMDMRYKKALEGETNPQEQLVKLLTNQAVFFTENPYFVVVVFSDGLREESERINQSSTILMQTKIGHLLPILEMGQKAGCFRSDLPAEDLVHIVMGSFRLLMYKWRVANFNFNLKAKNKNLIKSILTLIQN